MDGAGDDVVVAGDVIVAGDVVVVDEVVVAGDGWLAVVWCGPSAGASCTSARASTQASANAQAARAACDVDLVGLIRDRGPIAVRRP
jgi:hypothetical protein